MQLPTLSILMTAYLLALIVQAVPADRSATYSIEDMAEESLQVGPDAISPAYDTSAQQEGFLEETNDVDVPYLVETVYVPVEIQVLTTATARSGLIIIQDASTQDNADGLVPFKSKTVSATSTTSITPTISTTSTTSTSSSASQDNVGGSAPSTTSTNTPNSPTPHPTTTPAPELCWKRDACIRAVQDFADTYAAAGNMTDPNSSPSNKSDQSHTFQSHLCNSLHYKK
jgi:hypothetical protein